MPDHTFTVGSLFSGVGGFDLGLERVGGKVLFQCEADPYRRRVLNRHWPDVPVYPDVCALRGEELPNVDLLCGGFPCQDLSVAGRRAGLAGGRSGLFFEFARLGDELVRPGGWLLIENVPGLLSSDSGRDFAVILATLAELGFHDCAWRILDSRFFGVPQRRRRVYILARRARGRRSFEVLLESDGLRRNLEASWEARAHAARPSEGSPDGGRVASPLTKGSAVGEGVSVPGRRQEDDTNIVVSPAVTAKWAKGNGGPSGDECQNLVEDDRTIAGGDITRGLTARNGPHGRAGVDLEDAESNWIVPDVSPPLLANPEGGGGQRTTDVDTAVYAVGPEPEPVRRTFTLHSEASGAKQRGGLESGTAKSLDSTGGFAAGQGGTVVVEGEDVREAARRELDGGSRDVGGGGHGPDAELDGAGGRERGAGDASGVRRPESGDGWGDASHAAGGGEEVVGRGADPDARGEEADADGVRAASGVPGRVDDPEVGVFESRFARNGRGAPEDVCPPLKAQSGETGKGDAAPLVYGAETYTFDISSTHGDEESGTGVPNMSAPGESLTVTTRSDRMAVAYSVQPVSTREERDAVTAHETDTAEARTASDAKRSERGTLILENGDEYAPGSPFDPKPDGPRYAAMGDAVTVNVIEWLGVGIADHYERELSAGVATIPS
jgi:hypothetical protein